MASNYGSKTTRAVLATVSVKKRTKKVTVRSAPITLRVDDHSRVFTGAAPVQSPPPGLPPLHQEATRNATNRVTKEGLTQHATHLYTDIDLSAVVIFVVLILVARRYLEILMLCKVRCFVTPGYNSTVHHDITGHVQYCSRRKLE